MREAQNLYNLVMPHIQEGKTLKEAAKIIGKKAIVEVYTQNFTAPPGRNTAEVLLRHIIQLVEGVERALSMKP